MTTNQLTTAQGYNTDNMIFSDPVVGTVPAPKGAPAISYRRINITTKYNDGSSGDLILPVGPCFSFGPSENVSQDGQTVNGYSLPICLYNKDGATDDEKAWVDGFNAIVERCKDHLVENRKEIKQFELERSELKKLNPLYYKKVDGEVVEGTGPTLYGKLIVSKKEGLKILTMFFDFDGNPLNPLDLMKKYGTVKAAVKVESIFVGTKISLQVKLYEVEYKQLQSGMSRLLSRPKAETRFLSNSKPANSTPAAPLQDDDGDDDGSVSGSLKDESESDEPVAPVKKTKKKIVRKVRKAPAS